MMEKEFKLIIAGSRTYNNYERLCVELDNLSKSRLNDYTISIVSGMAKGADQLGHKYALEKRLAYYEFPANWEKHGKKAGFMRNKEMGDYADGLLAFWDGESVGTKHMIDYMKYLKKPLRVIRFVNTEE